MRKPMEVDATRVLNYKSSRKQVISERIIDNIQSLDKWVLRGGYALDRNDKTVSMTYKTPYSMAREVPAPSPDAKRFGSMERELRDGKNVVRLHCKTTTGVPNPFEKGRDWSSIILKREVDEEDWSDYNRLVVDIYPDFKGFHNVALGILFYNSGEDVLPNDIERDGVHFVNLKNHEWNTVYWEIPDMARDKVTAIGFQYRMKGNETGANTEISFDVTNLRIQKVNPDPYQGWKVPEGTILCSQVGFAPVSGKSAIMNQPKVDIFQVIRVEDSSCAYEGKVQKKTASIGTFYVADFSELRECGTFYVRCGEQESRPFSIKASIWRETVRKVINFYFGLRCGYPVPGIHDICHADLRCNHPSGKTIQANGGWHDAGDLSQGCYNTSDSVLAMLMIAEQCREDDPELFEELLEESRWGMEWLLRTRFDDGSRLTWITVGNWTDGIVGTVDDITTDAVRESCANLICALSEAKSALIWKDIDPAFSLHCQRAAEADLRFGCEDFDIMPKGFLQMPVVCNSGYAGAAAFHLWQLTGEKEYLEQAVGFADRIASCQQIELTDWDIPMRGFFYTDETHEHIMHWNHLSYDHAPTILLSLLLRYIPGHEKSNVWKRCLKLYGDYIKKTSVYNEPYGIMCASIYDLNDPLEYCPMENLVAQVKNGIRLSEQFYLKRFPVWYSLRGNTGTELTTAWAALEAAIALGDEELLNIVRKSLEWHVGRNPFDRSLIWGEGYNFNYMYSTTSGDIVGAMPVGVRTLHDSDEPYYPSANYCNWNEVWVMATARWLAVVGGLWNYDRRLE